MRLTTSLATAAALALSACGGSPQAPTPQPPPAPPTATPVTPTPPAANAPPVITGIVAQGQLRGAPRNFADLEDLVDVQATVQDAETPVDQLTFEWTAEAGAIEGSGRSVRWRAPDRHQTPADIRLTLTVIERSDAGSAPEQRVSSTVTIALHDSEKEIIDLGHRFLVAFSEQRLSPEAIVGDFTDSCRGKFAELDQVRDNQRRYKIQEWSVGDRPEVVVAFGAVCPFYAPERLLTGDGCAWFPVRWKSLDFDRGGVSTDTRGFDQVNAVFEGGRWRLCDSDYKATMTTVNGRPATIRFRK